MINMIELARQQLGIPPLGHHPQEAQMPKCEHDCQTCGEHFSTCICPEDCAHDWEVTGFAMPQRGVASVPAEQDQPEFVRLQCRKCGADVEEKWQ